MPRQTLFAIVALLIVLGLAGIAYSVYERDEEDPDMDLVSSFEECVAAGNPVMESFPRQCRAGDRVFVEVVEEPTAEPEEEVLIVVDLPQPNDTVTSPLHIEGEAVGFWYFEASFPVKLYDADDTLLATGVAQAQADWMTVAFVAFEADLTFATPATSTGYLVLEKDNPSGLPENDDSIQVSVQF